MKRYPRETSESKIFDAIFGGLGRLFFRKKVTPGRVAAGVDRNYVREEWQKIQDSIQTGGESRFQQAVIAADKLLDYALKATAPGETMGDRLINARQAFSDPAAYQAAWDAHKLRNRLVHETNYQAISWEARPAIQNFERALRNLGVL